MVLKGYGFDLSHKYSVPTNLVLDIYVKTFTALRPWACKPNYFDGKSLHLGVIKVKCYDIW